MGLKKSSKQLVDEANARVTTITVSEVIEMLKSDEIRLIDIREHHELIQRGTIINSVHIPRGVLEFYADPESLFYHSVFQQNRRYVLFCQSGWRSALATATLQDMGINEVAHMEGGFSAWEKAGQHIEKN